MNETDFVNLLRTKLPGTFHKTHGSIYTAAQPDLLGCFAGLYVGIECKVKDNTTSLAQERTLEKIALNGGLAYTFTLKGEEICVTFYLQSEQMEVLKLYVVLQVSTLSKRNLTDLFMLHASPLMSKWSGRLQLMKSQS